MNLRIFLIIVFLININQGIFTPIIDDEAYYWLWSTKLDAGYFDHPPMIALWIKLSDFLLNGEIGARFFTIIFNTISAFIFWKIANPTEKKEKNIFSIIYFSLILVQIFSFVSTPDAPLLFFTIAYLWSLKSYIKKDSLLNSSLLGICFAGLMYSKYHGVLVLVFTLLPIIKFWINKRSFYLAVLFSLILYSPHFIWLYQNDFPPISYHFVDRSAEQRFSLEQPLVYLLTAIFSGVGLLFIYIAPALKVVNTKEIFKKSVFWLVIGPFLFFLLSTFKDTTQAQWLLISYIGLGLIIYWYVIRLDDLKWFNRLGLTTVALIFLARICIMIPFFSPLYETKNFGEKLSQFNQSKLFAFEKYQEASIFQFYNQDKIGVVYRTIGNRHSQFSLWNTEELLSEPFYFVSPWLKSNDSIVVASAKDFYKGKRYSINFIEDYTPIHQAKAEFLNLEEQSIQLITNQPKVVEIQLNNIDINILKDEKVQLSLIVTKDQQYNIVEEVPISMDKMTNSYEIKDGFKFKFDYQTNLELGEYKAYIALTPKGIIAKYQSKPIKIRVTE